MLGKQDWRCGMNRKRAYGIKVFVHPIPRKMLVHPDSRAVAMEVGIRYGVCNNSPAECTSSENGRCSNEPPIACRHVVFYYQSDCRVGRRGARVEGLKRELG